MARIRPPSTHAAAWMKVRRAVISSLDADGESGAGFAIASRLSSRSASSNSSSATEMPPSFLNIRAVAVWWSFLVSRMLALLGMTIAMEFLLVAAAC